MPQLIGMGVYTPAEASRLLHTTGQALTKTISGVGRGLSATADFVGGTIRGLFNWLDAPTKTPPLPELMITIFSVLLNGSAILPAISGMTLTSSSMTAASLYF